MATEGTPISRWLARQGALLICAVLVAFLSLPLTAGFFENVQAAIQGLIGFGMVGGWMLFCSAVVEDEHRQRQARGCRHMVGRKPQ